MLLNPWDSQIRKRCRYRPAPAGQLPYLLGNWQVEQRIGGQWCRDRAGRYEATSGDLLEPMSALRIVDKPMRLRLAHAQHPADLAVLVPRHPEARGPSLFVL